MVSGRATSFTSGENHSAVQSSTLTRVDEATQQRGEGEKAPG